MKRRYENDANTSWGATDQKHARTDKWSRRNGSCSSGSGRSSTNNSFNSFRTRFSEDSESGHHFTTDNPSTYYQFPQDDVFAHPSQQFRGRLNPDPECFQVVAQELSKPIMNYPVDNGGKKWKCLTRSIFDHYSVQQQQLSTMRQKIDLWNDLYRVITIEFDCSLFIFGSTFNGFGGSDCDVDMCLFARGVEHYQDKQKLNIVKRLLETHYGCSIRGRIELIPAKVPILKFRVKQGGLSVDLSVDNPTSIRNTHLLYYYSKSDSRLRPLVLAVKKWAKYHGINEAKNQTLSSYTLTLMMINYLQVAVQPPVLPCLQQMYPDIFFSESDLLWLDYRDQPRFVSENRASVASLLIGFFHHYSSFNCRRDVASVRTGKILNGRDCEMYAKTYKLGHGQWKANLLVEEPFDRTNAARAVCNDVQWQLVKSVFKKTSLFLRNADISTLKLQDLLTDMKSRK